MRIQTIEAQLRVTGRTLLRDRPWGHVALAGPNGVGKTRLIRGDALTGKASCSSLCVEGAKGAAWLRWGFTRTEAVLEFLSGK